MVGNGSRIYRHVSSFLRVDIGGSAAKNDTRNALANSASVDDTTVLPCRYRDHVQRQTSRADRPRPRNSLSPTFSADRIPSRSRVCVPLSNCDRRDGDSRKQGNDPRGGRRGSSGRSVRTLTVQVLLATRNPTLKTEIPEERWNSGLANKARPLGVSLLRRPFEA